MTAPAARGIELVCLDMAGTTVADGDAVMESFAAAVESAGLGGARLDEALEYARTTMGRSKIEVFQALLGDADEARRANAVFEHTYAATVAGGGVAPQPGATELFSWCRAHGVRICLTTGFAPRTRDAILERLDWSPLIDLAVSPADAGRGRPAPDMVLSAVLRLGITAVQSVAVAGDTVSDVESGRRAGAAVVAGVLTGVHDRPMLEAAGATHVLDSVADLRSVLATRLDGGTGADDDVTS